VAASVPAGGAARLLPLRTRIELSPYKALCPDLALVTVAGNKLLLAAEVVSSQDHIPDTVVKKGIYEQRATQAAAPVDD